MCFSATASFTAAGFTGIVGIVTMARMADRRERALAAMPLLFAAQQTVEGLMWLNLMPSPTALVPALTMAFLFFAEPFWPLFVPMAVLAVEDDPRRRSVMRICQGLGVAVGLYLLWNILTEPRGADLVDGHIVYTTHHGPRIVVGMGYLAATVLPLVLSSRWAIAAMGVIVLVGSAAAYVFYWEAYVSVWCFFAAAASLVLLAHVEHGRQRGLSQAAA
jgi:hypothetical protein